MRELARRVDRSPAFVSRVERDPDFATPSEETINRLAAVLGLDEIDLMCAAGRVPESVRRYLVARPDVMRGLRGE